MFGKKKNDQALYNTLDDSRVTVYDFKRRPHTLFESYRPAEYRFYPGLSEEVMMPKLDRHLEAMLAGDVDDANGDMLNNIIIAPYREALADLKKQRSEHRDMIRRLAANRDAHCKDLGRILEERTEELERLEQEDEEIYRKAAAAGEG